MASRILAILAAVGMIAGASVYRYGMPGGDGDGGTGDDDGRAGALVCAAELGSVCDALPGAQVQPAAMTFERLVAARSVAEAGVADWVAPGPWADMVDESRSLKSLPPLFEERRVVAATPIVAVVKKGKTPQNCGPSITWTCLADAVDDPINRVGTEPAERPVGLFVRAGILVGRFGGTEFGSNDFGDAQGTLDAFATRNREAVTRGATDLQRFLISAPDVPLFLTTAAAAVESPAVVNLGISPQIDVQVIVASRNGEPGVDVERLVDALEADRWVPVSAGDAGLPSPGVLVALREALQ